MKKTLVTILCCTLFVSNFTACNKEQEAEVSQATNATVAVESTSTTAPEIESTTEASTESTIPETTQSSETIEQINYRVELTAIGDDKFSVIEKYRKLANLELKEARDIVNLAPYIIFETTNKEEAEDYKTSLEECGATVTIYEGDDSATDASTEIETTVDNSTTETETTIDNSTTENESSDSSEQTNNEETTGGTFAVNKIFNITDVGTVITGKVEQGTIKLGDKAVIVLEDGTEIPVTINRIEIFGGFLEVAEEGKDVSLGFEETIEKDSVLTAVSIVVKAEIE